MAGERVLVVDDEPTVRDVVRRYLERDGYQVEVAADGPSALGALAARAFDLVVLDLMLPGVDGLQVCRTVREAGTTVVIMLTAKADEADRIVGLELGADDYVVKPFSGAEVIARIRAVLRRTQRRDEPMQAVRIGGLELDPSARRRRARTRRISSRTLKGLTT